MIPISKKQNKNLSKYLTRIEAAERHRDASYKELWERCYKRYRNYVDQIIDPKTKKVSDRSNISIPYTFLQVETILPRLIETLFASRPYVRILEREPSDSQRAKNMEVMLDFQMNERFDIREKFAHGLKECCIYGTTIAYTGWHWEEKEIIRRQQVPVMDTQIEIDSVTGEQVEVEVPLIDEVTGEPVTDWQPVKVNEIVYDDPIVKFVDLGLFYVDPYATDIDDARYCGHDEFKTKAELQELVDRGELKINWKHVPADSAKNQVKDNRLAQVGLPSFSDQVEESDDDALYRVTHYWEDNKHVVIINRGYIAKEGENPYWHRKKPYRKGVYIPVPHEFYGMGIVEIIEDLQDELNTERNMRIDYKKFLLRRMWKVRRGSNVKQSDLVWRQGGIVYVDEQDDVQEIGVSDQAGSSFTEESQIKQDIRDATGAHDVVMGLAQNRETATTTMTKDNNASVRFRMIISSLEKQLLVGITRLIISMNQQFIDTPRWVRVIGGDGTMVPKQLSPEDIQGEFDLIAAGSSVEPMANKEAFKQRMIELYSVAGNDPIYQQFPEKRINLLRKVFESFDIKDTNLLLPTDEEYVQFLQNQKSMMMQQIGMTPQQDVSMSGMANTSAMEEQGLPNRIAGVPEQLSFPVEGV